jgi:UDP-N-acetylglucosamine 2-epimerase
MKIVSVVGARPNFVKLAPIHRSLSPYCDHVIIHTGQHYDFDMSNVFFKELLIPTPDINLGVGSMTSGAQIAEMINGLENEFTQNKHDGPAIEPDLVLVYGDTNSTFAGAMAASVNRIPVAHVESGLRSFDRRMPEERNRILTDHLSDLLFAPTETAVTNLDMEHVSGQVINSGDLSVEIVKKAWKFSRNSKILEELSLKPKTFILFTMHRAESAESYSNLKEIIEAFREMKFIGLEESLRVSRGQPTDHGLSNPKPNIQNGETREQIQIVFPIHPRTEKSLESHGLYEDLIGLENVKITKPMGYINFLRLIQDSYKVVTDSGGVQKEAYLCSVPCITIRKSTEWIETLEGGWNKLCNFRKNDIVDVVLRQDPKLGKNNSKAIYGDGNTSEIIRESIFHRYT